MLSVLILVFPFFRSRLFSTPVMTPFFFLPHKIPLHMPTDKFAFADQGQ